MIADLSQRLSNMLKLCGKRLGFVSDRPSWRASEKAIDEHFERFPVLPARLPENDDRLVTLQREGLVVVRGLFDGASVDRIKAILAHDIRGLSTGTCDAPKQDLDLFPECGRFRLHGLHKRMPELSLFSDHPTLRDLVRAYLSDNDQLTQLTLELRKSPPDWDVAIADLNPHADHIFREVKIYLALEDIDDDNGPLVFWTGTHRRGEWRRLPDYLASIGGVWGEGHIFTHNSVAALMSRSPELANSRAVRCTMKAGDVTICDVRGLHRASHLRRGERWHIYSSFGLKGYVRNPVHNQNWLQPLVLS